MSAPIQQRITWSVILKPEDVKQKYKIKIPRHSADAYTRLYLAAPGALNTDTIKRVIMFVVKAAIFASIGHVEDDLPGRQQLKNEWDAVIIPNGVQFFLWAKTGSNFNHLSNIYFEELW